MVEDKGQAEQVLFKAKTRRPEPYIVNMLRPLFGRLREFCYRAGGDPNSRLNGCFRHQLLARLV